MAHGTTVDSSGGSRDLRRIALIAGAVVVLWLLYEARYAILLVYASVLLATGLSPIVGFLQRHRLIPFVSWQPARWVAALLVYIAIALIFVAVLYAVVPPMIQQTQALLKHLPPMLDRAQQVLIAHGLESQRLSIGQIVRQTTTTDLAGTLVAKFWNLVGGVFGLIVMVFLSFYLLVESGAFFDAIGGALTRRHRKDVRELSTRVTQQVGAWMVGQLLLCGIIGCTTALGLGLLGLPYFYVLALIAAVGEFIPYAGPVLAAIPGIGLALTTSWQLALFVTLFYLAQQQLEAHVLVPNLMQHQVGLSSAMVIIVIVLGTALLGILGAILAVPTAAVIYALLDAARARQA